MLYTIAVVLIILWLLGLVTSYTIGGFIHILLVVAIIMILLRLISGRGVEPRSRLCRRRCTLRAAPLCISTPENKGRSHEHPE